MDYVRKMKIARKKKTEKNMNMTMEDWKEYSNRNKTVRKGIN